MSNRTFSLCFWIISLSCLFNAVDPKENKMDPISEDEKALISDHFSKFYIGAKELDMRESSPSCFASIFSSSPKIPKCLEEDAAQFLNVDMKNSSISQTPGADCEIFKFTRPSDKKLVAVKKLYKKDYFSHHDFLREVRLIWKFKGEGFTANIDCIFQDSNENMYYMMEYLPGKTLNEVDFYNPKTDNFNVKWVNLCLKMATIVAVINAKKVAHFNINLDHWIVAPDGRLYIIDFSQSRKTGFLHPKSTDAFMLGRAFETIAEKMLKQLGKHLRIKDLDELKCSVSGRLVDLPGIDDITQVLQKTDTDEMGKVIDSLILLEQFKKKHQV